MKRNTLFVVSIAAILLLTASLLSAQTVVLENDFSSSGKIQSAYGSWKVQNGKLTQTDVANRLAKCNIEVPQSGVMQYEFDLYYEKGGYEDRMGGFGIQVFVDKANPGKSWGNGKSYLLSVNYDENPTYGGAGPRVQVYKSTGDTRMTLLPGYDLALPNEVLAFDLRTVKIPVKLVIDGNTGDVKAYDPITPNWVWKFKLDTAPGRGSFLSFRTNSLSVSVDNLKVTKLQ